MKQVTLTSGPYEGKYEILDSGKVVQIMWSHRGEERRTVGRGTGRFNAVMAVLS